MLLDVLGCTRITLLVTTSYFNVIGILTGANHCPFLLVYLLHQTGL